jgi:ubiquinone/menaquinone biosynthesis C-methylase UbiE
MSKENPEWNHNVGWQSQKVATRYDRERFIKLGGRVFDALEKRAISKLLDVIAQRQPVRRVLDVACGTGRISELLVQRGYQVTCGDISNEMLAVAQERLNRLGAHQAEFVTIDVYQTGYEDSSYDCVTCIRLFQHLTTEQRTNALAELGRVSKRYVIVNVMYTSLYYGFVRRLRLALGRYAPRYTASKQQIENELKHAGLRIVKSIFTQPGFNGNLVLLLEKTGVVGER